ncbi:MAG: insulinase family protein [Actinomycetia bacterium]|nr:insulinase family protein [Actinomycetes bacterium]
MARAQVLPATGGGTITRSALPGGPRVITETMPEARSASVGVWVPVGSRDETPALAGASHFLEHLLFKGTTSRTALDIAQAMDAVGGEFNALTDKEHTCYYATVLDRDAPLAIDIVCDVVLRATVASADVAVERGVVLEEIAMRDDDPGDLVHDEFASALLGDTPLGRPILGTVRSITALSRRQVAGYYHRRYRSADMVVAVAGNVDHAEVARQVRECFAGAAGAAAGGAATGGAAAGGAATGGAADGDAEDGAGGAVGAAAGGAQPRPRAAAPPRPPARAVRVVADDTEQANIIVGMRGLARPDGRRFALGVLSAALGGGLSSRLFQHIREERGLAYSVYTFTNSYADAGLFGVYAGCQPGKAATVLELIAADLAAVAADGLTEDEVERGKGQMRGGIVLGLEDPGSRMARIGKSELSDDRVLGVDELLARVEAVTADDVRQVAGYLLGQARCLTVVGPFGEHDFDGALG